VLHVRGVGLIGLIGLSYAVAAISYEFVEKPFLRLKGQVPRNDAGGCRAGGTLGVKLRQSDDSTRRTPTSFRRTLSVVASGGDGGSGVAGGDGAGGGGAWAGVYCASPGCHCGDAAIKIWEHM
jgi:hypothetical protein